MHLLNVDDHSIGSTASPIVASKIGITSELPRQLQPSLERIAYRFRIDSYRDLNRPRY
jgi:hypothetical protein